VLAKHSKSFSLIDCISVGMDRMQRNFEPMKKQVEAWQRSELTDVNAKVVIYEAFVEGKLEAPKHLAPTVHDLYFEPKYEEFRPPRTIWSLSNAFTSAFKELDAIPQFKATAKLGEFLETRFSKSCVAVPGRPPLGKRSRKSAIPHVQTAAGSVPLDRHFFILKPLHGLRFELRSPCISLPSSHNNSACRGRTKVILIPCNFFPSAAYCFMDAESTRTKGPQPREGKQMEGLDLEHVIERVRGHDAEALGEIYRQYVRRVFGLCRHMLDSRERAEDATSEVFLKLQRSIESYDGSIPFARWLLRVAGNQCIDVLRRQRRRRQLIVEGENENTVLEAPSAEPSPLGAVLSKEERVRVRDAIAGLPDKFRLPLVLRYYSELSYDEIARELGLQKNNVATLIFRAKQELRRKLARGSK
jgi:RNA polymerase sigma-70 factor (ECF subfamily)